MVKQLCAVWWVLAARVGFACEGNARAHALGSGDARNRRRGRCVLVEDDADLWTDKWSVVGCDLRGGPMSVGQAAGLGAGIGAVGGSSNLAARFLADRVLQRCETASSA